MLNNMKLGARMVLGFGLVILLVVVVGGLAILNMTAIRQDAERLSAAYVPQVAVANGMERAARSLVYAIREYVLSFDEEFHRQGMDFLKEVDSHVESAMKLVAAQSGLEKLKEGADIARKQVSWYRRLLDETTAAIQSILGNRTAVDAALSGYMDDCQAFRRDLQAGGGAAGRRTALIDGLVQIGHELRVDIARAQSLQEYRLIEGSLNRFAAIDAGLDEMKRISARRADLQKLEKIGESAQACRSALETMTALYRLLEEQNNTRTMAADAVLDAAQIVAENGIQQTQAFAERAERRIGVSVLILLAGLLVALALAVIVSVLLTRMVVVPVQQGVGFAQSLATGDLRAEIRLTRTDEIGTLAAALNRMAANLGGMVRQINESAARVASSAGEITSSARQLAEGAQNQASTLEQTSASVEELTASVEQVSEHAQNQAASVEESSSKMGQMQASVAQVSKTLEVVSGSARESMEKAQSGAKAVTQAVEAIQAISTSSERIAGIIGIIGDIADQTNLLALNAAIEAARAGEHGRGFAVVADEVSKLADRSSSSTKEIEKLIKESSKSVTAGVSIARAALSTMESIIAGADKTNQMVNALVADIEQQVGTIKEMNKATESISEMSQSISAATEEQTTNARQVSKAIENVNDLTQQAAGAAEKMSVAAEELSGLAQSLQTLMEQFKLAEGGAAEGGGQPLLAGAIAEAEAQQDQERETEPERRQEQEPVASS
jgi:methyl-accepting chemotaxis protein